MTVLPTTHIVYEPEYADTGWFDHGAYREPDPSTKGPLSWFWRDLTDDVPKTLTFLEPVFFLDPDTILPFSDPDGKPILPGTPILDSTLPPAFTPMPPGFVATAGIYVQVLSARFDDPDAYFVPIAIRALVPGNQSLKNEVRRIR